MLVWLKKLLVFKDKASESERLTNNKTETTVLTEQHIDAEPPPEGYVWMSGFGYKLNWYMVSVDELAQMSWTIQDLADAINLTQQQKMSWDEGINFGCKHAEDSEKQIYITAPYKGWVYIIDNADENLDLLDNVIANYYAFGSYRVADFVGWKKVQNNEVTRFFVFSCGEVWTNIGSQTIEENHLNFVDLSGLSADEAVDKICSDEIVDNEEIVSIFDEDNVIDICEAWTDINPCQFDLQPVPIESLPDDGIAGVLIR